MAKERHCPKCGGILPTGGKDPRHCPRCLFQLGFSTPADSNGLSDSPTLPLDFQTDTEPETQAIPTEDIGHFQLLSLLGEGGAGSVYLAEDRLIPGRRVALKLLKEKGILPDLRSLSEEASALAALQHPHIMVVHEIGSSPYGPFLAIEYLSGGSLAERLARSPLSEKEALLYARDTAQALAAAHAKGILHRDIKPANLLLTKEGQVRVADFGLALRTRVRQEKPSATDPTVTEPHPPARLRIAGTPGYMAPEILRGEPPSPQADQFAFGITFHQMLTGHKPQERLAASKAKLSGSTLATESLPKDLGTIIQRCISHRVSDRFPGMGDVVEALEGAMHRRDPSRRRLVIAIGGGILAVLLTGMFWQGGRWFQNYRARRHNERGLRALNEQRYPEALRAFVAAQNADPTYLQACVNLGVLAQHLDNPDLALAHLEECAVNFPDSASLLYNLGVALASTGNLSTAEDNLRAALEAASETDLEPMVLNELALVLLERGKKEQSLSTLEEHPLPAHDTLEGAYLAKTRGLILLEIGRVSDSKDSLRRALAGPLPSAARGQALTLWGRALEAEGDLDGARSAYSEALLLDTDMETVGAARQGLARLQVLSRGKEKTGE